VYIHKCLCTQPFAHPPPPTPPCGVFRGPGRSLTRRLVRMHCSTSSCPPAPVGGWVWVARWNFTHAAAISINRRTAYHLHRCGCRGFHFVTSSCEKCSVYYDEHYVYIIHVQPTWVRYINLGIYLYMCERACIDFGR